MRRALMNLPAALLLWLPAATAAQAMTPTETVKSRVDEALQGLSQTTSATPESAERRRTEIRRAADSLFDFTEMSPRSYIGKIDRYAGEAIAYTGERVDGDEASVRSQVVTAKGSQIPVEYRLHKVNENWTAYDVFIENVSLVGTYRSQFDRVIKSESFAD